MTTEEKNKPFVGTRNNISSVEELKEFLADIKQEQDYYFVRSPHKVSGIKSELQEEIDSSTEGQIFNSQWELRWKRRGEKYELLLLSTVKPDPTWEFHSLKIKLADQSKKTIEWQIEDRKALLYEANEKISELEIRSKETRFPKGFEHNLAINKNDPDKPRIGQRYFLNKQTATVNFVALTII